ncbi:ABC transporter permease, partial [candidate division KSB1 bacterium]|nr:ABC transporter permease [candidate division KSB1 bacterium]
NQIFTSPHLVLYPGLAIMITVLAFNLLGDGLRDAIDPRLKK